jgi:DnaK suppressor protein
MVKRPELIELMKKQNHTSAQSANNPQTPSVEGIKKHVRYSDEELKEFREIVIAKLEEARSNYTLLKETLTGEHDHGTDDTSPTFKLAEDASDLSSKEEIAMQASRLQKFIEQLNNALIRIENKSFGICSVTGDLIPKERLRSVPHTTKCMNAKKY